MSTTRTTTAPLKSAVTDASSAPSSTNELADGQLLWPRIPDRATPGWVAAHCFCLLLTGVYLQAVRQFPSSQEALAFYGVYHREPRNQMIHFVGVPLIVYTLWIFQAHLPLTHRCQISLPGALLQPHYPSWATVWLLMYLGFYVSIDVVGALFYAPFLFLMYRHAVHGVVGDQQQALWQQESLWTSKDKAPAFSWTGTGRWLHRAAWLHALAWYLQIHPGHKIFEGAQPAVWQSFGGAISTAPLFAFYEGVWFCGLRPQLHQQVLEQVDRYTREMCQSGAVVMRACSTVANSD